MADYPDWVMKHKKKGTYINYSKGKYYLYAAHSQRIKGTNKVKRICDGYLGRITQEEGLIPPKDKVQSPVIVMEYGLSCAILHICKDIHAGFKKIHHKDGDLIMIASILSYIYGRFDSFVFKHSYLSVLFPDCDVETPLDDTQKTDIKRGERMIDDKLSRFFKESLSAAKICLSFLYMVKINSKLHLSENTRANELITKYKIKMRR